MTLPAATSRRLLNLPQLPAIWVGGTRMFTEGEEAAYCGAWLDTTHKCLRAMEVSEQPFTKQQLTRLLVQAMEYPQPQNTPCRPQTIVVNDRELQFFLRGILLPLDIQVGYDAEIPPLEEFFTFIAAQVTDQEEDIQPLPPEYVSLYQAKVKELAQLTIWQRLQNVEPLKLYCEAWESPTLIALFMNKGGRNQEFGLMIYRGQEAFENLWQGISNNPLLMDDEEDELDDEVLFENDCLLLNFEIFDQHAWPVEPFFNHKGKNYYLDVGVIHPLEGMRPFYAPEEAEMIYVVMEAIIQFWKKAGKKFRDNAYPETQVTLNLASPLHSALTYQVQVSTDSALLKRIEEDSEEEPESFNGLPAIQVTPVTGNYHILFRSESQESVESLRQAVSYYQPGEVPAAESYPIVLLQSTKDVAFELAELLAMDGGVHHLTLLPYPEGEPNSILLLQTNGNHFLLFRPLDFLELSGLKKWLATFPEGQEACGFAIAYGMSGKTLRRPTLRQTVGLYEVFLRPNYIDRHRVPKTSPISRRK